MNFQMPLSWDAVIDGIQLILCLLILVFLIQSRRKSRQSAMEESIRGSGQSFNVQILTQTLKQQIDQAFGNIADTLAIEQRNLDKALLTGSPGNPAHDIFEYQSSLHQATAQKITPIAGDASGSEQLHEQIQILAVKGRSARQISEELNTPLGEVELVLSLHKSAGN